MSEDNEYDNYRKEELKDLLENVSMSKLSRFIYNETTSAPLYDVIREAFFICRKS